MRLLAILLLALLPPLRIEETTFEHLVIVSDVICVGTVEILAPVAREWIITREPMYSMTLAGVPLPDGAPKPIGPDAAERLLWNEMRRRILSLIPKDSEEAGDVKLELGG